jgi:hypothetical protein
MNKTIFIIIALIWSAVLQSQNITVNLATVSSADTLTQVTVPFYVSGLNAATGGIPVTALEFYVYYNNTQVDYVNATNFYSGTPASQWIFGSNGTKFGSNWVHPQLLPISIPDGTKLFDIVFYYKKPVNSILNVSETECVLVNAAFQQIPNSTINFVDGAINYAGFVPPSPGMVEIIPDNYISFPDTAFNVPVLASGFGSGNSSLSSVNLKMDFNNELINFISAGNFNSLLPADEWTITYQAGQNNLVCTWNNPLNENIIIPDNSTLFELVFEGADAGTTVLTFDSAACSFVHRHNGQPKAILSDFGNAEIEVFAIPDPPPGNIDFVPGLFVTYNDSVISAPVFMSGFGTDNSSLSNFTINVDFDNLMLEYLEVSAFNDLVPADEWNISYNAALSSLTFAWNELAGQNLVIPDDTKLFDISFKALEVGNTTLGFDSLASSYQHQFMGYSIPFEANYNVAQVQIYDWTVPLPGLVNIIPDYFVTNPDTLIYVPVVVSGFDQENSSLSDMQLVVGFDENILNFETATAFGNILPAEQWTITYVQGQNQLICDWHEPNSGNVAITSNTTIFELVFKATALGNCAIEFDSAGCVFMHQLIGSQQQIAANFNGAMVEVIEIPLPLPGFVKIVPETFITNPDSLIAVPFVVSGFGQENSSLSDMELVLEFDNTVLNYQTAINFNPLLPVGEWVINYQSNESRIVCTWDKPTSQNVSIPDNTTLFELVFKSAAIGESLLHFDSLLCDFTHQINGTSQQTTSNFADALVVVEQLPAPPPGLVAIVPDYFTSHPGLSFNVPLQISGFGENTSSLTKIELALDFDDEIIGYLSATAFSPLLPQEEWTITFQPAQSRMLCVWESPSGNNLAIPNNTALFELVFEGLQSGISPIEFDSASCVFTHQQGTGQTQLTSNFANATAEITEIIIPANCKVKIIPSTISEVSGNIINVPVVFFGFNNDTTTITAAEFYIDFDKTVLQYQGVTNFNPLVPQAQWIYNVMLPDSNRFACNWVEPTLQNLSIPDSTTVFEIKFLCLANETALAFDSPANVFVHLDQEANLIELPVEFSDGYVIVLPDNIETPDAGNVSVRVLNRIIYLENTGGIARVFNMAGQLVAFKELSGGINEIGISQQGIYLINVTDKNQRIFSGKIFIK